LGETDNTTETQHQCISLCVRPDTVIVDAQ